MHNEANIIDETTVTESAVDTLYKKVTLGDEVDVHTVLVPKGRKIALRPLINERVVVISQGSVVLQYEDRREGLKAPAHFILPANTSVEIITLEDVIWYGIAPHEQTVVPFDDEASTIEHFFTDGVYARKMLIPAGTQVPSHKHVYNHLSILAQGKVRVSVGPIIKEYVAPAMIEVKKDLVHTISAVEDSVWYCIHATDATDIESLESTVIIKE